MNITEILKIHELCLSGYRINYAYGTEGNSLDLVEYIGIAVARASDASASWTIVKYTYDADQRITSSVFTNPYSIWNDRATYF